MEQNIRTFNGRPKGEQKMGMPFYFILSYKVVFRILICGSNIGTARFLTLVSTFRFSALNVAIHGQDPN
jgi:hypothetical protein